jgi:hypothetical protein
MKGNNRFGDFKTKGRREKEKEIGGWRILGLYLAKVICYLCSSPRIVMVIKSVRLLLAGRLQIHGNARNTKNLISKFGLVEASLEIWLQMGGS